jgi:hypothetical protein
MEKDNKKYNIKTYSSTDELATRLNFAKHFFASPIPKDQILSNLALFINSKTLSRMLFMDHLYKQIVGVMGSVFEFGTRWGPNAAQFAALRGIYEPFNRHRKIVAFDTFTGFPKINPEDEMSADANKEFNMMEEGHLTCSENYEDYLEKVLEFQEQDNPLEHIKKFELVKGDATKTVHEYLNRNKHTIIALAYFDFDIYEPTKICLKAIKDRLVKGSILGFDELNDPDSPGETKALMEVFGLNNISLKRYPYTSRCSYFIVD